MTRIELEEKIKKLLALSSSPNSHEAQLAYEKAQFLMEQYNLEVKEQQPYIEIEYICPIYMDKGLREQIHFICGMITPIFGSFCLRHQGGKLVFIGTELSNKISIYAIDSLLNNAAIIFRKEFAKNRSISFPFAFWKGYYEGLATNFSQKFFEGHKKYKAVYDWIQSHYHLVSAGIEDQTLSDNKAAATAGFQEGKTAELRSGAGVGSQSHLLPEVV